MNTNVKRLFFGVEVHAPWPLQFPKGRLLDESHRHFTLAFLGNIPHQPLENLLVEFPKITYSIGSVGYFDSCLPLPPHHPNVISWHGHWFGEYPSLPSVQSIVSDWLSNHGYELDKRSWTPHVTLCRHPFDEYEWKKSFFPLPFYTGAIHLYESMGNLIYTPRWSYPVRSPFEEFDHTADMAFLIRGESLEQLYIHAFTALAFKAPEMLQFFSLISNPEHLDEIIIALNGILSKTDSEIGCPMKAVSFHGEIAQKHDGLLEWEMIVDV